MEEVLPAEAVREQAARLLRLHPLRAADALQLAAALVWADSPPPTGTVSSPSLAACDQRPTWKASLSFQSRVKTSFSSPPPGGKPGGGFLFLPHQAAGKVLLPPDFSAFPGFPPRRRKTPHLPAIRQRKEKPNSALFNAPLPSAPASSARPAQRPSPSPGRSSGSTTRAPSSHPSPADIPAPAPSCPQSPGGGARGRRKPALFIPFFL